MALKGLKSNKSLGVRVNESFLYYSEKAFAYAMQYRSHFTFRKSKHTPSESNTRPIDWW